MSATSGNSKFNPGVIETFYDINEELGRGSFAVVKGCTDKRDSTKWAVKIITKAGDSKVNAAKKKASLDNEIECWSELNHPNVVFLRETFESPASYYIVQELVVGGELFDQIVERTTYTEDDAKAIMRQLCVALQHMHDKNIAHRDIKPENLLLSDKSDHPTLKLADFGLACSARDVRAMTKPVGTPGYIAPEVLITLDSPYSVYGKEVDIWSMGVIMIILLTGCPPFYADDDDDSFDLTLAGKYDLSDWTLSAEAKDLIAKILTIDPYKRISIPDILAHPWFTTTAPTDGQMVGALTELRKFNAKRHWKMAINAAKAANRFSFLQKKRPAKTTPAVTTPPTATPPVTTTPSSTTTETPANTGSS